MNTQDRVLLEIKTSRKGEETPEVMVQFLASLTGLNRRLFYFWRRAIPFSLEIAVIDQMIHFYISIPSKYQTFIESQLVSQYPKALITKVKDYLPDLFKSDPTLSLGQMKLNASNLYPLRTTKDFKDVDPMSSFLGVLSKNQPGDVVCVQFLLRAVNSGWQSAGTRAMEKYKDKDGVTHTNPYSKVITEKIAINGFKTAIRIAVNAPTKERSFHFLHEIANSFSSFNNPSGNSLSLKRPHFWRRQRLINAMLKRSRRFMPTGQILNVQELATIFHFPTEKLATIHNISWHKTILSEPPETLPIAEGLTDEEKSDINFIARTEFKNKSMVFGIKGEDRRKHVYIIGKTGTGKSTLIANMVINDIRNKRGMAIIDPHGDLCETLLDYIPSFRINDVVYLDPSDTEYTFSLNPLEVQNAAQKELVVSGFVSIFKKIYGLSWGPRLEYILRNTVLSVIDLPDATMLMIPEMLTNDSFRHKALEHIQDPILRSFWVNEFEQMHPRLKSEAMSPILNKVGQFISSNTMRNVVKNPKSTIDLEKVMNEGKILLMNLSQGKIGEDNAALLGAMTITKFQLAAMNRVHMKESDRRDFYLYVDEFQNFATQSFIKILSEARKYRLNLILANQYIAQIPEDVRAAIFGNAGTMLSFIIGATDGAYMAKEFGERFKEEDLLALGNYQAIIKLSIEGITQPPFLCFTLPLPRSVTQSREKVIRSSRERYMKPVKG
ncbi:MAG: type IV secretion system DNA-binding domain-containing protein [Patescibacteria group bacterium]|nr:type IV secretion system DNA-binding domain-containing protein [Patescibacteria group bacterium]